MTQIGLKNWSSTAPRKSVPILATLRFHVHEHEEEFCDYKIYPITIYSGLKKRSMSVMSKHCRKEYQNRQLREAPSQTAYTYTYTQTLILLLKFASRQDDG
jgi:hypothetical protein